MATACTRLGNYKANSFSVNQNFILLYWYFFVHILIFCVLLFTLFNNLACGGDEYNQHWHDCIYIIKTYDSQESWYQTSLTPGAIKTLTIAVVVVCKSHSQTFTLYYHDSMTDSPKTIVCDPRYTNVKFLLTVTDRWVKCSVQKSWYTVQRV